MNENESNLNPETSEENVPENQANPSITAGEPGEVAGETTQGLSQPKDSAAEIAKLKAEINRLSGKNDALARENAEKKKQLNSYKTAEEIREEERQAAENALKTELEILRKERAVANIAKKAFTLSRDEEQSNRIAEYLYGAEDPENALAEFGKIIDAAIKRLKVEYGKIPPPGIGGTDGARMTKKQLDTMNYIERAKFAAEYPAEYTKLMGR